MVPAMIPIRRILPLIDLNACDNTTHEYPLATHVSRHHSVVFSVIVAAPSLCPAAASSGTGSREES